MPENDLADLPSWCRKAPAHLCWPQAASVALLAGAEYDPDNTGDIFGLEPYYIRRSEAEELGKNASRNNDKDFDSGRFDCCQQHR